MRPDHEEFADGVKLVGIAVVSAVLVATLVIGAGRSLMPGAEPPHAEAPALTRIDLR